MRKILKYPYSLPAIFSFSNTASYKIVPSAEIRDILRSVGDIELSVHADMRYTAEMQRLYLRND